MLQLLPHQWAWVDFPAGPYAKSSVGRLFEVSISAVLFDSEGDTCSAMTSISLHPIRISELQLHFFFLLLQIKSPSVWSVCVVCLCCLFMRSRRRMYFKAPVCPAPCPCFAFNWISAFLSFQRSWPFVVPDIFPTHFPPVCGILRPFLSSALCLAIPIICLWGPLFELAFLLNQSQVSAVCLGLGYYIFGSSPNHWRTQLRAKMNPYHFISTKGSRTLELVDWLVVKNLAWGESSAPSSALGLDPCLFGLCFKS